MKYLPAAALELRRKTIDILIVMQSLRHENLNPFIGKYTTHDCVRRDVLYTYIRVHKVWLSPQYN